MLEKLDELVIVTTNVWAKTPVWHAKPYRYPRPEALEQRAARNRPATHSEIVAFFRR